MVERMKNKILIQYNNSNILSPSPCSHLFHCSWRVYQEAIEGLGLALNGLCFILQCQSHPDITSRRCFVLLLNVKTFGREPKKVNCVARCGWLLGKVSSVLRELQKKWLNVMSWLHGLFGTKDSTLIWMFFSMVHN